MKLSVLGLGYVGAVSAGCLASDGHEVIGNAAPEFWDVPKRLTNAQTIIDLVRITDSRSVSGVYEGICW